MATRTEVTMLDISLIPDSKAGSRLEGKVALVLGAGASGTGWGNGNAVAAMFAREGAAVAAVDINREAAEEVREAIARLGGHCEVCVADGTRKDDLAAAVARCLDRFGRIDILHNNMGGSLPSTVLGSSEADWRHVLDRNLTAALFASQCVLPAMIRQGGGSIIHISSNAAVAYPRLNMVSYSAAKAGLHQLSRAIAMEHVGAGIRSNCIVLGHIDTPEIRRRALEKYGPGRMDEIMAARASIIPMKRVGTVWEVAYAALYLASDESAFMTGAELILDGGTSIPVVPSYQAS